MEVRASRLAPAMVRNLIHPLGLYLHRKGRIWKVHGTWLAMSPEEEAGRGGNTAILTSPK